MKSLEDKMTRLASQFEDLSKGILETGGDRIHAGIWDKAAKEIRRTIKDHNRWHQEPT